MAQIDITITHPRSGKQEAYTLEDIPNEMALGFLEAVQSALTRPGTRYTVNHLRRLSDGATIIDLSTAPKSTPLPRLQEEA
jgi:hypothetical protein